MRSIFGTRTSVVQRKLLVRRGNGKMEIMNGDGSDEKPFRPEYPNFLSLTSCDDKYVIFDNHNAKTIELWRADADGGNPTKLAENVLNSECSPDGKWVLYSSGNKLYRIDVRGGSPKQLEIPGQSGGYGAISRDGERIAFRYHEKAEGTPEEKVAVLLVAGGSPMKVFTIPGDSAELKWSPDEKGVQYLLTRKGATNVWEQKLSGGEPRQVTDFASGEIFDFDWTRDGKTLLLAKGEVTRDVVMISKVH